MTSFLWRILSNEFVVSNICLVITTLLIMPTVVFKILNIILDRRKLYSKKISSNRMNWIIEVRSIMTEFLIEYQKLDVNQKILNEYKTRIEMYIDYNNRNDYSDLQEILTRCFDEEQKPSYMEVLRVFQFTLKLAWERMKYECGVDSKANQRITNNVINDSSPALGTVDGDESSGALMSR